MPCTVAERRIKNEHHLGELESRSTTASRLEAHRLELPTFRVSPVPLVACRVEDHGGAMILTNKLDMSIDADR